MQAAGIGVRAVVVQDEVVAAADLGIGQHDPLDGFRQVDVGGLAEDMGQRLPQHLQAGLDDEKGDDRAKPGFERKAGENEQQGGDQRGGGDDAVHHRVLSRVHQSIRVQLFALLFHVAAQEQFCNDRQGDDNQGCGRIVGDPGMDDLLDGLCQGRDAGVQHDQADDHGAQVLDSSVAEGVLLVRFLSGQLRADDGDDAAQGVAEVVHGVQDDGDRAGDEADGRLGYGQQHVDGHTDDAGAHNLLFPGVLHGMLLSGYNLAGQRI